MSLFKPFEELPTSTSTYIAYSNIDINLNNIFKSIPIFKIDPPLTKKKKNIDKKKITAPYGSVIGIRHRSYVRGEKTGKDKDYWCLKCQKRNAAGKKICTVKEILKPVCYDELIKTEYDINTKKMHFLCSDCKSDGIPKEIAYFLNQVTIDIYINNRLINVMIFKNSIKFVGSKCFNDIIEALMVIWEDYIGKDKNIWKHNIDGEKDVKFRCEMVMKNLGLTLGFPLDKTKTNTLFNQEKYSNIVFLSKYESSSSTHVNLKMYTKKPEDFKYNMLVYENNSTQNPKFTKTEERLFAKKDLKKPLTTFIIFSSSEIILTGRYLSVMKDKYEFFINLATKHRNQIEEIVDETGADEDDDNFILSDKDKLDIMQYLKL